MTRISPDRLARIAGVGALIVEALETCVPDASPAERMLGGLAPVKIIVDRLPLGERVAFLDEAADTLRGMARRLESREPSGAAP